jgi:predicted nucleotidyltransferase
MGTNSKSLGDLLFGQTRGRVLALLYGMPDQTFFVRQIAREIGTSVGSVQRELETLSEVGLLNRTTIGRQVFYQANSHHPAFADVRSLIAKTSGIFHQLRSALHPLASQIIFALVYGSIARGDEDAGSDVDLMIVGNVTLDDVLAQLAPVENAIGRSINPTVYSLKEFKAKVKDGNHFLTSVLHGKKMLLIGDEDELRKVG